MDLRWARAGPQVCLGEAHVARAQPARPRRGDERPPLVDLHRVRLVKPLPGDARTGGQHLRRRPARRDARLLRGHPVRPLGGLRRGRVRLARALQGRLCAVGQLGAADRDLPDDSLLRGRLPQLAAASSGRHALVLDARRALLRVRALPRRPARRRRRAAARLHAQLGVPGRSRRRRLAGCALRLHRRAAPLQHRDQARALEPASLGGAARRGGSLELDGWLRQWRAQRVGHLAWLRRPRRRGDQRVVGPL
mmetsp:Transcript_48847/g.104271  ORF Transcript_48847/g.104271 Transcript_48847/m.104271 type:complete len:251 (-) Transcript_48847:332-1084(-)